MDLGATICLSKKPRCLLCPLSEICQAYQLGIQEQRPVLKPKAEVPHYTVTAAVIRREGRSYWQSALRRVCWAGCGNSPEEKSRGMKHSKNA